METVTDFTFLGSKITADGDRLFCPWDFSGKNTEMGCHFLLQENFLTQGLNPGLPNCQQILHCLKAPKHTYFC